jgi:Fe-S cluster biogenesis protein NfuA/nitrite reductase/ring-hydroxylating ferredoxin subunit
VKNVRAVGDRIEQIVQELGALGDSLAQERTQELVQLLMEFYGAGLERIVELTGETGNVAFLERMAAEPLVASLLLLHNLHPVDTATRVERALEQVRPYLASHGGNVEMLGIDDGVARLRLLGSCHGCGSSTVTMKLAIEQAIQEAAPELEGLEVEGVIEPAPTSPLIQVQLPGRRAEAHPTPARGDWMTLAHPLDGAGVSAVELAGVKLVLCRVDDDRYAYRDVCPSCGSALAGGALAETVLACPACPRHYDVRQAGRCLDAGAPALTPLPLLQDAGGLRISVPAAG